MEELVKAVQEREQREFDNHKNSLKVTALTQRVAHLVANYEEQMADLRSDATLRISALEARVADLSAELEKERGKDVSQDAKGSPEADDNGQPE